MLDRLRADPARLLSDAGIPADPWQAELLCRPESRTLLLCSRQAGKSTVAAALALRVALLEAPALVLLLSPTIRQSGELFRKCVDLYRALGRPVPLAGPRENQLKMELSNGSRIISLPGEEGTVRCFSGVKLLVLDEAARTSDSLIAATRPMLAVSGGRLIALSTPFGKLGWFHAAWSGTEAWRRIEIKATDCPRISAAFLAEEKDAIGERWYRQEYLCSFEDTVASLFAYSDLMAACERGNTLTPYKLPD